MFRTYTSPPDSGWTAALLNLLTTNINDYVSMQNLLLTLQTEAWYLAAAATSDLSKYLGAHPAMSPMALQQAMSFGAKSAALPYQNFTLTADSNGYFGILGSFEDRFYTNISQGIFSFTYQPGPYSQILSTQEDADIDDELSTRLNQLISSLATIDKSVLFDSHPSATKLLKFYLDAGKMAQSMPYGAIFLNTFDTSNLIARYTLHFGSDTRVDRVGTFPSKGQRLLTAVAQLGQASMRGLLGKYASATITQGIRAFPEVDSTAINLPVGGYIGRVLFPFGVSFLLPIFTIILVKEKEDRLFIMMKLNGLNICSFKYFQSHYITFYLLYALSAAVFLLSGLKSGLTFFTQTQTSLLVLLFMLWGHVQIILSFLFSTIFNKSRIALVLVFLIVLIGVVISIVTEKLFVNTTAPLPLFIWPPFAFYRALSLINTASFTANAAPYQFSIIRPGNEVFTTIVFMVGGVFVYALITAYLLQVLPSDFGIQRPWHFPVSAPLQKLAKNRRKRLNNGFDPRSESQVARNMRIDIEENSLEDEDVKNEKRRIDSGEFDIHSPLVLSHMRKIYSGRKGLGPKFAVKDVSFAADVGSVFGLLGPNGAGKTTLISILTGLYPASAGSAALAGYDVKSERSKIYEVMGICPQFDILWDDLTVEEHLYFYARLKGATRKIEHNYVNQALANVSLSTLRKRLTKSLSGGEKRRLSIAIALVGNPKVVFLDEPTTGLDPEVRRLIWNIIQTSKEGKLIVLTTHSMEEAEALCNRIGIMAKGTLRCIGNSLRLKNLYGSGFRLYFNTNEGEMQHACNWVETILPKGFKKMDSFATMTAYEFPAAENSISLIFSKMESGKAACGILDWGISQTNLEDVFIKIISDTDANAD
ncbi:hypothetical protein HDU84_001922 [Entophlyctis sp. JEL0112]|nr:hypothetical protein HDU84_001922 [Entophlyctis sp. JEL0112]